MTGRPRPAPRPAGARRTHPCPGCGVQVPTTMFACRGDWLRLPQQHRGAVGDAWAAVLMGVPGSLQRHAAAKAAATTWLKANR